MSIEGGRGGGGGGGGAAANGGEPSASTSGVRAIPSRGTLMPRSGSAARLAAAGEDEVAASRKPLRGGDGDGGLGG